MSEQFPKNFQRKRRNMMRSKWLWTVVMLATMVAGGVAHAASDTWFGGWVDDDFFVAGNWTYGQIPNANWNGIVNQGLDAVIYGTPGDANGQEYIVNDIKLGEGLDNLNTLTMNSGSMNATGPYFVIGSLWTAGQGTLTMNGGRITMQACYVGSHDTGIVNINNGELYPWGLLKLGGDGGVGTVNLDGGLVLASDLTMVNTSQSIVISATGMLDVTSTWSDVSTKVLGYVTEGRISAGTGYQLVTTTYTNPASGYTGVRITTERIEGDIDGDGDVDMEDFALLAANWSAGT